MLSSGVPEAQSHALRRATLTGEPLGSREFVAKLESQAARRLRVLDRGRPRKKLDESATEAAQMCLLAG
jgi:hypothetical protein